jgi:hypothetical protein
VTNIAITLLALACAALSVGVAGLLRRITDVKLALGGYSGEVRQFMIDIGRRLPESVLDELPDSSSDALLVVATTSCDVCERVLAELDRVPGQVVAAVIEEKGVPVGRIEVAAGAGRLSSDASEELVRDFDITQVPVAIAQRDGYVVGAAYGTEIGSGEKLREFWTKLGVRPSEVAA